MEWSILKGYQYQDNPSSNRNGEVGFIVIPSSLVDSYACHRPRAPRSTFISEELEAEWCRVSDSEKMMGKLVFAQDAVRITGIDTYVRPAMFVEDYVSTA